MKVVKDTTMSAASRRFSVPHVTPPFATLMNREKSSKRDEVKHLSYKMVQEKRQKYLSPSLSTFQAFKRPFYPQQSYMQYLWDHQGNQYLDLLAQNLTISVGHNHPLIVEAVEKQIHQMTHCTTMYYHEQPIKLAEKLVNTMPPIDDDDWVVHFVNSGSEAVDLALLMSRAHTKNWDVLSLRNSYHGLHSTAMGLTGMSVCTQNIPGGFGVHHVMNPDMYRGQFADDLDQDMMMDNYDEYDFQKSLVVEKYVKELEDTITYNTPGSIGAFIFEQIQGYGGIMPMPDDYIPQAAKVVCEAGGLVIADEVQTGYGRMGNNGKTGKPTFWSFELNNTRDYTFVPDIVVTAKGLGNGLPIAAVIAKRSIAESITERQFFNTYGGNPTVCAVGNVVLDIATSKEHQDHVHHVGHLFRNNLDNLWKFKNIGDVRGQGLMYGVEIVKPNTRGYGDKSKEPDSETAGKLFEELRDQGLIMGLGGLHKNVLRVMPPMCVTEADAKFVADVMDFCLEKHCVYKEGWVDG